MSNNVVMRLWFIRETPKARLYTKVPPERHPTVADELWIPRSVIEHTTKRGAEHEVTIQDWWVRQKGL